jgi:hypothetical protein
MTFQKKHKLGFISDKPLAKEPICLKLKPGMREQLMTIPGWQDKLRTLIEILIQDNIKPS